MRKRPLSALFLAMAASATPALADLTVDATLGTLGSGTYSLSGTTVGQPNQAFTYKTINNASGSFLWGNGEYVYQFTLTKPSYLAMMDTVDPEADNSFPDPNNDYFLLNSLTTTLSDNTSTTANAAFGTWADKPEGSNVAVVQNSVNANSQASSANLGVFRYTGAQVTPNNPTGLWAAGTYYISVDSSSGTPNSYGQSNQLPAGSFSAKLRIKAADEVVAPTSTATEFASGGQVSGQYDGSTPVWVSFDYTAGTSFSLNTNGNTLGGSDTLLFLYDSNGLLVKVADDNPGLGLWSQLDVTAADNLASGQYYLALGSYKMVANQGFDLTLFSESTPNPGTWVINGLSPVPEPTALALLAVAPAVFLRRKRR